MCEYITPQKNNIFCRDQQLEKVVFHDVSDKIMLRLGISTVQNIFYGNDTV